MANLKSSTLFLNSSSSQINNKVPKHILAVIYPHLAALVLLSVCLNLLINPLFIAKTANSKPEIDTLVNISGLGVVRGAVQFTAVTQRPFRSFTGIPYGNILKRFAPAVLKEPLTGTSDSVFDATLPQKVWQNKEKLPVIVFMHGGSFFRWSGKMFNGRRLLERDAVLVVINYRLNIFGFFCLENDNAPGNIGLYDIILSLQWVQKYIQYFGGDKGRITLAGQSAGGAAVTTLLDSPLASGLFHGIIAASGDSFAGWAVDKDPLRNSLSAANLLGCANGTLKSKNNLQIVLNCMRGLPPSRILDGMPAFFSAPTEQKFPLWKFPKIIPHRKTSGPRTHSHKVPLMIGVNRNDGSFLASRIYTSFLQGRNLHNDSVYLKNHFMKDLLTSSHFGFIDSPNGTIDSLAKSFLGNAVHGESFSTMAPGLVELFSQFYFTRPAVKTAIGHESDVYFYSFNYEGSQTLYPYTGGVSQVPKGVAHGDDLMYLFDFGEFASSEEQSVSSILVNYWVNFASTGNPNKRTLEEPSEDELWPKYDTKSQLILKISPTPATDTIRSGLLNL